jgi:nicotinamide-nucleotide amidase
MSASNKKQAMLPAGAERLHNPVGTAPGFHLKIGQCSFFFMPGVPSEMERMLDDKVIPKITALGGERQSLNMVNVVSLFGIPEAVVGERLSVLSAEFPKVGLGIRAKFPEIYVKLSVYGKDAAGLNKRLAAATAWAVERMGDHVISAVGKPMETVVGELLAANETTLAVAESCTGGLVSHLLTNVPGSSDYFLGGAITYSNEAKQSVLGVALETLEKYGAVHEETAKEMAVGAKRISGAGYGLATSGIAGPSGGTVDKPVGTLCVGLATPDAAKGYRFFFPFNRRSRNKSIFAMTALDLLRKELLL